MSITEKYVDFILDYLGEVSRVQLLEPQEDGKNIYWKSGSIVTLPVKIEVLAKYTRSANLLLRFDKYKVEYLFFMPIESSPESIIRKINTKIAKIVNDTLIKDGRSSDIKQLYEEKRARLAELLIKNK